MMKEVQIYTDGACKGNPGPGGYGVILRYGEHVRELADGRSNTTNNRMELLGCIAGLNALTSPCRVDLYSDSQYVVNAMKSGSARRWQQNGWMRSKRQAAKNPDLWQQLLDATQPHQVSFHWVKGHAGHLENERCDELATAQCERDDLKEDIRGAPETGLF